MTRKLRNPLNFFVKLMQQPLWIPIWVTVLMAINVASVAFWSEPLARIIFIIFMFSAMLMMGLYSRFGFTKILGMGHVLWLPLLIYVLIEISSKAIPFKSYLIVWSILTAVSLGFDIVDVWKYFNTSRNT